MMYEQKSLLYSRDSMRVVSATTTRQPTVSSKEGTYRGDAPETATADSSAFEQMLESFGVSPEEAKPRTVRGLPSGETPLHVAGRLGRCDIVQFILQQGADVDATDSAGYTALHSALESGRMDVARRLVLLGANVNASTNIGNTSLHHAAAWKDVGILQLLLESGANVGKKNFVGRAPLHHAAWQGDEYIIRQLCQSGADVHARDDYGNTAFHMSIDYLTKAVADVLITYGADFNARNMNGQTPLHLACVKRKRRTVNILLETGADCNVCDAFGATPLHYAVYEQMENFHSTAFIEGLQDQIVSKLLQYCSNCTARTKITGQTALHLACVNPVISSDVLNRIIGKSKSSSFCDYRGNTYMHYVAKCRGLKCMRVPPTAQSILHQINDCGQSALHLNAAEGKTDWQRSIFRQVRNNPDRLLRTCIHSYLASGAGSLENCYQYQTSDRDFAGRNCLHYACINKPPHSSWCRTMCKSWIKLPELANQQDVFGRTPLFYAALYQQLDFISELILAGADPRLADIDGVLPKDVSVALYTPTHDASHQPEGNKARVVILDSDSRDYSLDWLADDATDHLDARTRIFKDLNTLQKLRRDEGYATSLLRRVKDFVAKLTSKIGELDSMFQSEAVLVGSGREGTRAKVDDEFDFMLILNRFAPLIDITAQNAQFPGFFRFKLSAENGENFQRICDAEGIVQPLFVKERLYTLVIEACSYPCVWKDSAFEYLKIRIENRMYSPAVTIELPLNHIVANNNVYFYYDRSTVVSIDLVPAVPTELCVSPDSPFGRYASERYAESDRRAFVVMKPQKFKLSSDVSGLCPSTFILLESEVVRDSPAAVKAAYVMLKRLLFGAVKRLIKAHVNKYALKQCVVQCIVTEAFAGDCLSVEVTVENLAGCISVILQHLWQYILNDAAISAVHNKPLAVWEFEPFVGFLRVYFGQFGIPHSTELPPLDECVPFTNQVRPFDMVSTGGRLTALKVNTIINEFRTSCERIGRVCSLFSVPTPQPASVKDTREDSDRKLRYALKVDDWINEVYVNEVNRLTLTPSPYVVDTTDVAVIRRYKEFHSPNLDAIIECLYDVDD